MENDKDTIKAILDYWFVIAEDPTWDRHSVFHKSLFNKWYFGGPEVDKELTEKFKEHLDKAAAGEYDHWKNDRDGRLAFVILCDQFSRNIYRG